MRDLMGSRWTLPGLCLIIGFAYLGAASIGGSVRLGLVMLAIMVVSGLVLLLAGRSETVRGLRGYSS